MLNLTAKVEFCMLSNNNLLLFYFINFLIMSIINKKLKLIGSLIHKRENKISIFQFNLTNWKFFKHRTNEINRARIALNNPTFAISK